MANTKLSSLTAITTPALGDEFYVVDVSDTTDHATGSSRKITYTNLVSGVLTGLGVTSSVAELNTLDGITASVAELNYTDGVTSAIQTQIDTKAPSASPVFSGTVDLNGIKLILDADADTSITADTDDQIDVELSGADDFRFTANTFTALSGSTIATNTIAETTAASGVTIDGLLVKDSALATNNSVVTTNITDANVTSRKMKLDKIQSATSTTDINSSSGTYVDVTGATVTFTPDVASTALVLVQVTAYNSTAAGSENRFVVDVDGSTWGNDPLMIGIQQDGSSGNYNVTTSGFVWVTGLTVASHTIKLKAKVSAGTIHTTYASIIVIPFAS